MPVMLYIFVIFIVLIAIGFFWFMSNNNQYRQLENSTIFEREINLEELFLKDGLKALDNYSDKGRWMLFLSVFLLLIEFFAFITFFIQNAGTALDLSGIEHLYFIGGLVYFFLLLFSLFLSIRMTSITKEIPHFFDNYSFSWKRNLWDQKLTDLEPDQKKRLSLLIVEKRSLLEQNYSASLILIACSVTILLVMTARWLFTALI